MSARDADKLDANIQKTQELSEEFNDLRKELENVTKKKESKERTRKKAQLQARMHEITMEMTKVVQSSKACAPTVEEIGADEDDDLIIDEGCPEPADINNASVDDDFDSDDVEDLELAKSASIEKLKLPLQRYASTSDEDEEPRSASKNRSSVDLRNDMKAEAKLKDPTIDCTVVKVTEQGRWSNLFGSKAKSGDGSRQESLQAEVSALEKELEELSMVEGKGKRKEEITNRLEKLGEEMLETGSRKSSKRGASARGSDSDPSVPKPRRSSTFWKRNPARETANRRSSDDLNIGTEIVGDDDKEMLLDTIDEGVEEEKDSDEAISRFSHTLRTLFHPRRGHGKGNGRTSHVSTPNGDSKHEGSPNASSPPLPSSKRSSLHKKTESPMLVVADGNGKGSTSIDDNSLRNESPAVPSRKKSRLSALSGAASKTFLFQRRKHHSLSPVTPIDKDTTYEEEGSQSTTLNRKVKEVSTSSQGAENAFDRLKERMAMRGEKLSAINAQAEDMNHAAQDLAAVAKKLRQQQEKKWF